MATEHWFDRLHRTLTEEAPRRGLLRSAGALVTGLALGAASQDGLAKKRGKGKKDKKKGKGNGKGNGGKNRGNDQWGCEDRFQNLRIKDPNCSGGRCKAQLSNDPCEEKYCEFICNQCDGDDPRDFCITDASKLGKIARCCVEGEHCCEDVCCAADTHCCGGVCCPADWTCNGNSCSDPDPGAGCDPELCPFQGAICIERQCACPEGREVCNGECNENTVECVVEWPGGESRPWCYPPDWHCCPQGHACPDGYECCEDALGKHCNLFACPE